MYIDGYEMYIYTCIILRLYNRVCVCAVSTKCSIHKACYAHAKHRIVWPCYFLLCYYTTIATILIVDNRTNERSMCIVGERTRCSLLLYDLSTLVYRVATLSTKLIIHTALWATL
jgi:hypothetical protein